MFNGHHGGSIGRGGWSLYFEVFSCVSGEMLKSGGKVDGGTGSNSAGEFTGLHLSGNSSGGELETSSGRSADGTSGTLSV